MFWPIRFADVAAQHTPNGCHGRDHLSVDSWHSRLVAMSASQVITRAADKLDSRHRLSARPMSAGQSWQVDGFAVSARCACWTAWVASLAIMMMASWITDVARKLSSTVKWSACLFARCAVLSAYYCFGRFYQFDRLPVVRVVQRSSPGGVACSS